MSIKEEASKHGFTHEIELEQEFGTIKKYYKLLDSETEESNWKAWRNCSSLGGIAPIVYNPKQGEVYTRVLTIGLNFLGFRSVRLFPKFTKFQPLRSH